MYAPVVSSKTIPDSRPKWTKCFQTKKAQKPQPFGAAHTYMAYIREYPIPGKKKKIAGLVFQKFESRGFRYDEQISLVSWQFVKSRFHCTKFSFPASRYTR